MMNKFLIIQSFHNAKIELTSIKYKETRTTHGRKITVNMENENITLILIYFNKKVVLGYSKTVTSTLAWFKNSTYCYIKLNVFVL